MLVKRNCFWTPKWCFVTKKRFEIVLCGERCVYEGQKLDHGFRGKGGKEKERKTARGKNLEEVKKNRGGKKKKDKERTRRKYNSMGAEKTQRKKNP